MDGMLLPILEDWETSSPPIRTILLIIGAFLACILFLTFYVIHWRRTRAMPASPIRPPPYIIPHYVSQAFLLPEDIEAFPTRPFHQGSSTDPSSCPICLSTYPDGIVLCVLPVCGHAFHMDCVSLCFKSSNTCPICRCDYGYLIPRSSSRSASPISLDGLEPTV